MQRILNRRYLVVGGLFVAVLMATSRAKAQSPPVLLRNYLLLQRLSSLHVSGGFAGFNFRAPVGGSYRLATGWDFNFPPPSLTPFAQFVDVDAYWVHPLIDVPPPLNHVDLDETVNLSGLEGEPIPYPFPQIAVFPPPIELFRFEGEDGQGTPLRLYVATLDGWMFMRGRNHPDCCDFFNYEIRGIARQTPFADFNADNTVGAGDFAIWSNHYGTALTSNGVQSGDVDGDGDTDGGDFLAWQTQVGESVPTFDFDGVLAALSAAESSQASAIPEPATGLLLLVTVLCTAIFRTKRSLSITSSALPN